MRVSLCKHSFPCQPPHGSIFRPGNCTDCGITYDETQANLLLQEEALIVGSSYDGECPDCCHLKRLFRWQPPAQPWDEPGAEHPVTFLCMDCYNAAVDERNALVNSLLKEASRPAA